MQATAHGLYVFGKLGRRMITLFGCVEGMMSLQPITESTLILGFLSTPEHAVSFSPDLLIVTVMEHHPEQIFGRATVMLTARPSLRLTSAVILRAPGYANAIDQGTVDRSDAHSGDAATAVRLSQS